MLISCKTKNKSIIIMSFKFKQDLNFIHKLKLNKRIYACALDFPQLMPRQTLHSMFFIEIMCWLDLRNEHLTKGEDLRFTWYQWLLQHVNTQWTHLHLGCACGERVGNHVTGRYINTILEKDDLLYYIKHEKYSFHIWMKAQDHMHWLKVSDNIQNWIKSKCYMRE